MNPSFICFLTSAYGWCFQQQLLLRCHFTLLKALWPMVGDKMGDHGRSSTEVESPYCIFGGTVCLLQSRMLAHAFGPGFDQESLQSAARIGLVAEVAPVAAAAAGAAARRGLGTSKKG
jgi:hypothetical protein